MGCYNQYIASKRLLIHRVQKSMLHTLALWGLVTNYGQGVLQNGRGGGGASEILLLQKGG